MVAEATTLALINVEFGSYLVCFRSTILVPCIQDLDQNSTCTYLEQAADMSTHSEKTPQTKVSDKGSQHRYRLGVFIYLHKKKMAEQEELGTFLVGKQVQ